MVLSSHQTAGAQEQCANTVLPDGTVRAEGTWAYNARIVGHVKGPTVEDVHRRIEERTTAAALSSPNVTSYVMVRHPNYPGTEGFWNVTSTNIYGQVGHHIAQADIGHVANCPSGYRANWGYYGGKYQSYCTSEDPSYQNCPDKPKPNKTRGAPPPGSCHAGNPCDVSTGNKFQKYVDYSSNDSTPLVYARYYNSDKFTPFSWRYRNGWRDEYDRRLIFSTEDASIAHIYNGPKIAILQRHDGKSIHFNMSGSSFTPVDPDTVESLTQINATTYQLRASDDSIETYSLQHNPVQFGRLDSIFFKDGSSVALSYDPAIPYLLLSVTNNFGRTLSFAYSSGRLSSVTDPAGNVFTYVVHPSTQYLTDVYFPDNTPATQADNPRHQYLYADSNNPGALTSVVENGVTYASWTYDAQRRATSSQHTGGVDAYTFTYNANGTRTVTDSANASRTYTFSTINGVPKYTSITDGTSTSHATWDTNGWPATTTDKNGNIATYQYNSRGLEISRIEAYGTARARTITTQWHSTFRLPTQIDESNRRTTFTYDSSGNQLTKTITDTSTSTSRTWTYTYNSFGRVLTESGPRTDVNDITTYTYYNCTTGYQCGQVATITNPAGHVTSYLTYNAHGQPLTYTDANGVLTTLTYDQRQRLTSRTTGTETASFTYYLTGLLQRATLPDGSYLNYTYDAAHRLTAVEDSDGNRIAYTLDAMGNRTAENLYDPSNALTQTRSRLFNTLNRLTQEIGSAGTTNVTTTFGYDNNGNQTSVNAPLSRNTASTYDELNRLTTVTDPNSGVTTYGYNALDQLISVNDPRSLQTTYTYNALDDLTQQVSPDTGTTTHTYDSGGNVATTTDARNVTATYSYDALNRVTQAVTTDQTIQYQYDQGTNAAGRLSSITDNSGQTAWTYDAHGRVTSRQQTMGSIVKTIGYDYASNGRLETLTLPSGHTIDYGYSNGRIASLTLDGSTTILSGAQYEPFGPIGGWTWGNTTLAVRIYDQDGNIAQLDSAGLKTYGYDSAYRITGIIDATDGSLSQTYSYDALDRLTTATGTNLNQSWTYDANGNRLTQGGGSSSSYTNSTTSNRVSSISGALTRSYSYDATGNTLSDGTATYIFDNSGRMISATNGGLTTSYTINALGQRVRKNNTAGTTHFVYDEVGHLIGEYGASGNLVQEIIWLDDTPVAVLKPNGGGISLYYIHSDHLNTPRKITRPSDNAIVWRWDHDPFGTTAANQNPSALGTFIFNLRFPGQYWDSETELHYNMARDYDAAIGRYVQSDPVGLKGGLNTYAYAINRPTMLADPTGETPAAAAACFIPGVGWIGCGTVAAGALLVSGAMVASDYFRKAPPRQSPPPPSSNDGARERADSKDHCTRLYILCLEDGWGGDWSCGQCHFFCTGINGYWPFEHCSASRKCR